MTTKGIPIKTELIGKQNEYNEYERGHSLYTESRTSIFFFEGEYFMHACIYLHLQIHYPPFLYLLSSFLNTLLKSTFTSQLAFRMHHYTAHIILPATTALLSLDATVAELERQKLGWGARSIRQGRRVQKLRLGS